MKQLPGYYFKNVRIFVNMQSPYLGLIIVAQDSLIGTDGKAMILSLTASVQFLPRA